MTVDFLSFIYRMLDLFKADPCWTWVVKKKLLTVPFQICFEREAVVEDDHQCQYLLPLTGGHYQLLHLTSSDSVMVNEDLHKFA